MEEVEKDLIDLCKDFLRKVSNMYFNSIITKEEFNDICEIKVNFLKERGVVF